LRAVTKATWMPARRSSDRPSPSCTWKALVSLPSLEMKSRPSVRVPSTSKQASRMRAARASTSGEGAGRLAGRMDAGSHHARAQQVVNVEGARHAARLVHDDEAPDLV